MRIVDKCVQAKVVRTLSPMNLDNKYMRAINNVDIDAAKNLGLTSIKKHWTPTGQIEKKVNGLHKD